MCHAYLILLLCQRERVVTADVDVLDGIPSLKQSEQHLADADPALDNGLRQLGTDPLAVGHVLQLLLQQHLHETTRNDAEMI